MHTTESKASNYLGINAHTAYSRNPCLLHWIIAYLFSSAVSVCISDIFMQTAVPLVLQDSKEILSQIPAPLGCGNGDMLWEHGMPSQQRTVAQHFMAENHAGELGFCCWTDPFLLPHFPFFQVPFIALSLVKQNCLAKSFFYSSGEGTGPEREDLAWTLILLALGMWLVKKRPWAQHPNQALLW